MKNLVILVGNLGKDPEVRTFENGNKVANFSLATSESYKNSNGEKVESTEWHNISAFSHAANFAENYLKKGDKVLIEGKIKTRSWEDNDGNKRFTTEIHTYNIQGLVKRDNPTQSSNPSNQEESDDIPF